ncbi:TetR/AcrR family transcriptional regulator [uncultured Roseobacter sp.]|uniref:TetR/AcrR family transcriptional regulator n=1 Tax=uncultured Roseobacter sp. TaxID=114847 RepID=UPI00262C1B64|nr:TetR/AcrR family transcriptional regulator [uncultured Roseobacter sp.]
MPRTKQENLKDALVDEAFASIEERGVEQLSLRDVARRLGVSHQAPYKHFPSRNHILAAVVARCFQSFADHLETRPVSPEPFEDLGQMGLAYLDFAAKHPLKYRLMFNTPLPDGKEHEEMLAQAQHAFSLLRDRLGTMSLRDPHHPVVDSAKHDALFIWSALHGFASLMQSDVTDTVGLDNLEKAIALERMMRRLSLALNAES